MPSTPDSIPSKKQYKNWNENIINQEYPSDFPTMSAHGDISPTYHLPIINLSQGSAHMTGLS